MLPTVTFREEHLPLLRSAGLGDYASIMASQGRDLVKPGLSGRRRTKLPLTLADGTVRTFYLKRYADSSAARREWQAIERVRAAGVPTMEAVAFGTGEQGGFVLVSAVPGDALSRRMNDWLARHGDDDRAGASLADRLGRLIGRLHAAGLAHRDFYTTHVFLHERDGADDLYLIDLARVFHPRWRKWRWRAKDLSQLRGSLPQPWAERHWPRIAATYAEQLGRRVPSWTEWVIRLRVRSMRRRQGRQAKKG